MFDGIEPENKRISCGARTRVRVKTKAREGGRSVCVEYTHKSVLVCCKSAHKWNVWWQKRFAHCVTAFNSHNHFVGSERWYWCVCVYAHALYCMRQLANECVHAGVTNTSVYTLTACRSN